MPRMATAVIFLCIQYTDLSLKRIASGKDGGESIPVFVASNINGYVTEYKSHFFIKRIDAL